MTIPEFDASETELAFQVEDRYISIQEATEGYDYSILGPDFIEIDGGVYDDPDISIREALEIVLDDLIKTGDRNGTRGNVKEDSILSPVDYDDLMEKNEDAEHARVEAMFGRD